MLIFALSIGTSQEESIVSSLIPNKDRVSIAYFFRHAIFWDTYGYVLLGDKPCAITNYKKITCNPFTWLEYLSPHNLKMKKGWETWKKYEHLFPHPKFDFLEDDSYLTSAHFIILIHREAFRKKIQAHLNDFQNVLEIENEGEILDKAMTQPLLNQVLRNHDGLIGTLLGYGRNNAWSYHEKSKQLNSFLNKEDQLQMKQFCSQQGFWSFFTGTYCRDLYHLALPGFAANLNDPETEHLRRVYSNNRDQIIARYQDGDFLETTLTLLCF